MPDSAVIIRTVETDDGQGGTIETPTPFPPVPCRVERPMVVRPAESEVGGALLTQAPWILTFPAGTDVTTKDDVEVTHENGTVRMFEVSGPMDPQSYDVEMQVLATEVY